MDWQTHFDDQERANDTAWDIPGYYGRTVAHQANAQRIPTLDGVWDIHDVSNPTKPRLVTGTTLGCVGVRYALYWVANYGLGGHDYSLTRRRDNKSYVIRL